MDADKGMEELHKVELGMLVQFRQICDNHNFTYYLSGGTFLGAVRHNGFIPWDDDVDVAMPREDYQKFVEIVNQELPAEMEFKSYTTDKNYHHPVARLVNNNVCVKNYSYSEAKIEPAWIDIFPLDGMPENKIRMNFHKINLLWKRVLIGWANYTDVQDLKPNRPVYEKILMYIGKTFKIGEYMDLHKEYARLEKTLMSYPAEKSKVYMNFNGSYRFNSIMNKEYYYGDGAMYLFEGELFNAPKNYDAYLTKIYGNYMKEPPVDQRNKHLTEVVRINN